eukprot:5194076-Amphidinium_carterae.1
MMLQIAIYNEIISSTCLVRIHRRWHGSFSTKYLLVYALSPNLTLVLSPWKCMRPPFTTLFLQQANCYEFA